MEFSKWHALGNTYLVVEAGMTDALARRLCDVHLGIGADGVLSVAEVDGSEAAVAIWNPDGSVAELSGNGARIAAGWLAARSGAEEVLLRTETRDVRARVAGDVVCVELGTVEVGEIEALDLPEDHLEFTPVSVGNPHAVIRREPERAEVLRLGPLVEHHERFPGRTNVQFVRVDDLRELTVGVWERGAGETASSGTSAVASAAAGVANGWCESPVTVHLPGGDLRVELDAENRATLTGPVAEICRGELLA